MFGEPLGLDVDDALHDRLIRSVLLEHTVERVEHLARVCALVGTLLVGGEDQMREDRCLARVRQEAAVFYVSDGGRRTTLVRDVSLKPLDRSSSSSSSTCAAVAAAYGEADMDNGGGASGWGDGRGVGCRRQPNSKKRGYVFRSLLSLTLFSVTTSSAAVSSAVTCVAPPATPPVVDGNAHLKAAGSRIS